MSGELQPVNLRAGMRFALRNVTHEISHIDAHQIRYSSCQGGRSACMPTQVFWSLVDDQVIGILEGAENATSATDQLWQYAERDREEMHRRFTYVRATVSLGRHPTSRAQMQAAIQMVASQSSDASPPSRSTLARWIRAFSTSNGSIASLLPRHAEKGRVAYKFGLAIEMLIRERLISDYLTANRDPIEQVYCNIVSGTKSQPWLEGEALPSRRTVYRRAMQIDQYVVTLKRYGKRIADAKHSAAGSGLIPTRPMQYVMIDGHHLDVLVVDEDSGEIIGRPFLTCLFDVMTRCVVGWHLSMMPFCATTAMAAVKHMCSRDPSLQPGGVPEILIPDNGPDLASIALRNLCRHVCLTISPAKKYSPNDKAHLERFFRTLNNMFSHRLPGTTFSSARDRQGYGSEKYACMTIDDVRALFENEFLNAYHTRIHSAIQRAPLLAWKDAQEAFPIPHFSTGELEVVARVPYNRTINKGRVRIEGLFYKSNSLRALELRGKGDVVVLLDELNLAFVYVQDPTDCTIMYRADAVLGDYAKNLTMYEHDQVRAKLKNAKKEDLLRLGEHAYEIARHELWEAIQKRKLIANKRKRGRLGAISSESQKTKATQSDRAASVHQPSQLPLAETAAQPAQAPARNQTTPPDGAKPTNQIFTI